MSNEPKAEATAISYDVMVGGSLGKTVPCKRICLPFNLIVKRKRVFKGFAEDTEHSQAASNISSSGMVQECLVSRQGLGRTQMLLENPLLIFDWLCAAVQRRSLRGWGGCTAVDLFRCVGFGGTGALSVVGKMVIRAAHATCSGGPALMA